jgi:endonuclease-3
MNDHNLLVRKAAEVHRRLILLYGERVNDNPSNPIDELVLTVLSQNTNDVNRDKAYAEMIRRFPNWEDVMAADTDELIDAVRIAGLANQKGPRIQNILRQIKAERGELKLEFLKEFTTDDASAWLTKFKGVGPKTAAIVLQFALEIPAFPVDTHVYRISGRLGLRPEKMSVEKAHKHLEGLFQPEMYYAAHLNIITHGRAICHARKPKCEDCPLQDICDYWQTLLGVK